jgi:hypothetical protein
MSWFSQRAVPVWWLDLLLPALVGLAAAAAVVGAHAFVAGTLPDWVTAGSTLVAAFLGSWFAFFLADRANVRRETEARAAAGKLVQQQIIDPHRNDRLRYANMRAIPPQPSDVPIDFDSIIFLIQGHPQVLADVMLADVSFRTAIQAINRRSKLHTEHIQPVLEPAGIFEGMEGTEQQLNFLFKKALGGNYLFDSIVRSTDQAIEAVDRATEKVEEAFAQLRAALVQEFFGRQKFFGIGPMEHVETNTPGRKG